MGAARDLMNINNKFYRDNIIIFKIYDHFENTIISYTPFPVN
ncbi:MAG: hypothetical protein JWP37_1269 [Mucilaginibacter sp.]|nr:hypothetical protein [Mucilaginibacter sp.]